MNLLWYVCRFPDDAYDRIWEPSEWGNGVSYLSTNETPFINNGYNPPKIVMSSAVVGSTAFGIVNQNLDRAVGNDQYYSYFHFTEVQKFVANQTREFNIYLDSNEFFYGPFSPEYLGMNTLWSVNPHYTKRYNFSITGTPNSTFPPALNAYEVYSYNPWNQSVTNAADSMRLFINLICAEGSPVSFDIKISLVFQLKRWKL